MDAKKELDNKFLTQEFVDENLQTEELQKYKTIASAYAQTENAIAVLSDLKANTSYIYYGGIAEKLGITSKGYHQIIHSIWEINIFKHIHPEDLNKRHLEELHFLQFLKSVPKQERMNYYMASNIRMCDSSGNYVFIRHRIFYVAHHLNGSVWLALCLYNMTSHSSLECHIFNTLNGKSIAVEQQNYTNIISDREKEILRLIDKGKLSKEIAYTLSISIHTVHRHRQNILEKLQANNSIEACQIAKQLHLLS